MSDSNPSDYAVTVARSAFAAIPWFGGALNEAFFDHRARTKLRPFEEFVNDLGRDLRALGEAAVDREFLASEAFGDLVESTIRRIVLSGAKEKRERLRKVLVNQISSPLPSDYQELFLDLASEVSEKSIAILSAYRDAWSRPRTADEPERTPKQGDFRDPGRYGLAPGEHRFLIQHLIARGLMYDDSVGRWNTSALQIVEISDLGLEFLRFVEGETA